MLSLTLLVILFIEFQRSGTRHNAAALVRADLTQNPYIRYEHVKVGVPCLMPIGMTRDIFAIGMQ